MGKTEGRGNGKGMIEQNLEQGRDETILRSLQRDWKGSFISTVTLSQRLGYSERLVYCSVERRVRVASGKVERLNPTERFYKAVQAT